MSGDEYDRELQLALQRSLEPPAGTGDRPVEGGTPWSPASAHSEGAARPSSTPGPVAKRSKSEEDTSEGPSPGVPERPLGQSRGDAEGAEGSGLPSSGGVPLVEDEAGRERRLQREIRAAAAEKRIAHLRQPTQVPPAPGVALGVPAVYQAQAGTPLSPEPRLGPAADSAAPRSLGVPGGASLARQQGQGQGQGRASGVVCEGVPVVGRGEEGKEKGGGPLADQDMAEDNFGAPGVHPANHLPRSEPARGQARAQRGEGLRGAGSQQGQHQGQHQGGHQGGGQHQGGLQTQSQELPHPLALALSSGSAARIPVDIAVRLFDIVFGVEPPRQTLTQWSNQGFRFSDDPATSLGLVQREGGPCGVLAPVQALLLKYLLFSSDQGDTLGTPAAVAAAGGRGDALGAPPAAGGGGGGLQGPPGFAGGAGAAPGTGAAAGVGQGRQGGGLLSFSENERKGALVAAMAEMLWVAGDKRKAALALVDPNVAASLQSGVPEAFSLDSAVRLQQTVFVVEYHSAQALLRGLRDALPAFQCPVGALLMLFSAILSRTVARTQGDRDDPVLPLVTKPFGHASQEIVNLLLCGQAVPNVFDGIMDIGGGMALKGIPGQVEVGFLTLLESLNYCKVGQHLKCPRLPIWVVGSESHYTVLFALDRGVQEEDGAVEAEERRVRQAFDRLDTSGGGGFITPEALDTLSAELGFQLVPAVKEELAGNMGVIVWQDLWQALLQVDTDKGGLKHLAAAAAGASQAPKRFNLFHFNGIAKSVTVTPSSQTQSQPQSESQGQLQAQSQGPQVPAEVPAQPLLQQRPRLTKLYVSVPPKWTPPDSLAIQPYTDLTLGPGGDAAGVPGANHVVEDGRDSTEEARLSSRIDRVQHAPLADCIRTRWPRAACDWDGDAPSIV